MAFVRAPSLPFWKGISLKSKGFALVTVLLIVIIVPIVVFGITFFITASITRYETQTTSMKALYLAEAGIHRAIFNIKSTGAPLPVDNWGANNEIAVTVVAQCSNVYQLKSVGTATAGGQTLKRTVFAQVDSTANKVQIFMEGDGTGVPPPTCCDEISWPFSEGSGNTTGTAPYQGTLTAGSPNPEWVADRLGTAARALRFNQRNPTNYVVVADPNPSVLDLTTAGTVMAWIRPASIPNQSQQTIVHKGGSTAASNAYALFLYRQSNNQGRVRFWIYNAAGTQYVVSGSTNMGLNTWYHIAGVWDSTGLRVYRNGAPNGTNVTANRVARTNNNNLYIGASGALSAAQEFNGTIDEVYVFGCRKTDAEIKAYYNSTCAGSGATPCPQP